MSEMRTGKGVTFWAGVGLVTMLAYALSIGPVAWLVAHALPPSAVEVVLIFYMPLLIVAESTASTLHLLQWYVYLWAENVTIGV